MRARFEWDPAKAAGNLRKHGIGFETAVLAFADPLALTVPIGSESGELRWQTLGTVAGHLLVLVAHTIRDDQEGDGPIEVIRVISARRADRKERRRYEQETC